MAPTAPSAPAELTYFVAAGHPRTTGGQVQAFVPGFLLIMAGLVIAGPWLTMVAARLMARRARRPASLIAARRLADSPGPVSAPLAAWLSPCSSPPWLSG